MTLAIIVVNYGSSQLLSENLVPLSSEVSDIASIIVVDNLTTSEERSAVRALGEQHSWTVLTPNSNTGFGGGVNLGADYAIAQGATALLALNPDLRIDPSVAHELNTAIEHNPMQAVSPRIVTSHGTNWFSGGELDRETGAVRTTHTVDMSREDSWLTGACLAIGVPAWQAAGGFDPDYFLYWEDVDFSQRLHHAGVTLTVRDDLVVEHEVGGTQGAGKSAVYVQYNCRNRLLYASRWLNPEQRRQWVNSTPAQSWRILRRGGRSAVLSPRHVWAAISGSLQGWRAVREAGRS